MTTTIVVQMSIERRTEIAADKYPSKETVAEFTIERDLAVALPVFQEALAALTTSVAKVKAP